MTKTTTALLLALGIFGGGNGWLQAPTPWFTTRALDQDERTAVALQCRGMNQALRNSCEQQTITLLVDGEFDPEPVLRGYCTRIDNLWAANIEIPPDLCIQRYGGWLQS